MQLPEGRTLTWVDPTRTTAAAERDKGTAPTAKVTREARGKVSSGRPTSPRMRPWPIPRKKATTMMATETFTRTPRTPPSGMRMANGSTHFPTLPLKGRKRKTRAMKISVSMETKLLRLTPSRNSTQSPLRAAAPHSCNGLPMQRSVRLRARSSKSKAR